MRNMRSYVLNQSGASAAEFALVLPIFLLFLVGIIDVGLYGWNLNRGEKATQIGARWAVATDLVPSGLADYSFAVDGGIPQGTTVPQSEFPGVSCTNNGCTCSGSCSFPLTSDNAAFTAIVDRMQDIKSDIEPGDVSIDYAWSGLGFSGDPNGPDVAPIVTVSLANQSYQPLSLVLFDSTVDFPNFRYSLTSEDGEGGFAN